MDLNERIKQFEQLVADDADNDMAWFSLGGAYTQVENHEKAAEAYIRCTEIAPDMSKAYQLAGQALKATGDTIRAAEVLTEGYKIAAGKGDLMPKNAMGELLVELGMPVPKTEAKPEEIEGDFVCSKTGKRGTQMDHPPFRGAYGKWIQDHISKQTFDEWIGLGTKLINELRLDLSRDEHEVVYDYAMRKYLRLDDATFKELTGDEPPQANDEYREVVDTILSRMGDLEDFQGEMHTSVGQ
ncbi:MAG: Fe(2+)-trafficking protein [Planctomycetota bacterium]